jgi:hypothetical protein
MSRNFHDGATFSVDKQAKVERVGGKVKGFRVNDGEWVEVPISQLPSELHRSEYTVSCERVSRA